MSSKGANHALVQVAKSRGLSVKQVRKEIDLVIREAMSNSDPEIQKRWEMIPRKGEIPTAEEVIDFVSMLVSFDR